MNDKDILNEMLGDNINPNSIYSFLDRFYAYPKVFFNFLNMLSAEQKNIIFKHSKFQEKFLTLISEYETDKFNLYFFNEHTYLLSGNLIIQTYLNKQINNKKLQFFIKEAINDEQLKTENLYEHLLLSKITHNDDFFNFICEKYQKKLAHINYTNNLKIWEKFSEFINFGSSTIEDFIENSQKVGIPNILHHCDKLKSQWITGYNLKDKDNVMNALKFLLKDVSPKNYKSILHKIFSFDLSQYQHLELLKDEYKQNPLFFYFCCESMKEQFIALNNNEGGKRKIVSRETPLKDYVKMYLESNLINYRFRQSNSFAQWIEDFLKKMEINEEIILLDNNFKINQLRTKIKI